VRTRRLGRAGPEITVLGLGSWVFSGAGGLGLGPADDQESINTIHHALESGINWLDTAPIYGIRKRSPAAPCVPGRRARTSTFSPNAA
jgi:aryl-alcohol dehydrogenase-like predicted oxidoreductase